METRQKKRLDCCLSKPPIQNLSNRYCNRYKNCNNRSSQTHNFIRRHNPSPLISLRRALINLGQYQNACSLHGQLSLIKSLNIEKEDSHYRLHAKESETSANSSLRQYSQISSLILAFRTFAQLILISCTPLALPISQFA